MCSELENVNNLLGPTCHRLTPRSCGTSLEDHNDVKIRNWNSFKTSGDCFGELLFILS